MSIDKLTIYRTAPVLTVSMITKDPLDVQGVPFAYVYIYILYIYIYIYIYINTVELYKL